MKVFIVYCHPSKDSFTKYLLYIAILQKIVLRMMYINLLNEV